MMILAIKIIEIDVNRSHLMRRVLPKWFFFLLLDQGDRYGRENVFRFGLIFVF